MNKEKLNIAIEVLKSNIGESLIETDIITASDGISIVGYNSNPTTSLLFNYLTTDIINTLRSAKFPSLKRYIIMDLESDRMLIILPLGDYRWGIVVDSNTIRLGVLLNVAIPKSIEAFEEAL